MKIAETKPDSVLSFENHVTNLGKKVSQKLHALAGAVSCMNLDKRKCLMKAFIVSQFNCCPLIWMFYCGKLILINKSHESALKLIFNADHCIFGAFLGKQLRNNPLQKSTSISYRNLKVKTILCLRLWRKYLSQKNPHITEDPIQATFSNLKVTSTTKLFFCNKIAVDM